MTVARSGQGRRSLSRTFSHAGAAGADVLLGGGGNDRLAGGENADTLTGGNGKDHFVFFTADFAQQAAVVGGAEFDLVTDFGSQDSLEIEGTKFTFAQAVSKADSNGSFPGVGFSQRGDDITLHFDGETVAVIITDGDAFV